MSKLLNVLALLVLGGLVGVVGWWTNHYRSSLMEQEADIVERDRRIDELKLSIEAQAGALLEAEAEVRSVTAEKDALELRNKLLLLDHRLARVEVVDQRETADGIVTEVRFIELGADGKPIGEPKQVEVRGRFLYLESQVVKFSDEYVAAADPLRGTSICLFRRVFGEQQRPMDGPELDSVGRGPGLVKGDNVLADEHAELWQRFWDYANDPELAREAGVRAVHGEAPFTELRPGKSYRVELRASGGLSITPE
jgi:hypothetical protein